MQSQWVSKRKKIWPFGLINTLLIIIFLVLVTIVSSVTFWYKSSLESPGGNTEKIFIVKKGEGVKGISERLQEEGLIKNALVFRILLFSTKADDKIEAGSFRLNSNQTAEEIANELKKGKLDKWVILVEGLRVEEIAEKLGDEFDIDKKRFLNNAKEGFMFPDTYLIPVNADEKEIASILRNNFDKKVTKEIINQARKNDLSLSQLVTLASIVERETRNDDERPIIAGILLKRLHEGIRLEADATIQYALGYQVEEKVWWKKVLTIDDLEVDSLYNTRKVVGLPPGPISNPGIASIKAVINQQETAYYFYLHDKEGKPHYAKTLDEHNENISKYLN